MATHSHLHVDVVGPPAFATALAESDAGVTCSTVPGTPDSLPDRLDGTDCLLLDPRTAGDSWRAAVDRVTDARPRIPVVVLVDAGADAETDADATVAAAIEAGATDWLPRSLCEARPDLVVGRLDRLAGRARPSHPDDPVERFDRPTATHDPETGRLRDANEALVDLLGYDRDALHDRGLGAD